MKKYLSKKGISRRFVYGKISNVSHRIYLDKIRDDRIRNNKIRPDRVTHNRCFPAIAKGTGPKGGPKKW